MNILGYNIEHEFPGFPIKEKKIINTINPHSYCVAKKDAVFRIALQTSNILIPDGIGIVWAARILRGEKIQRITGADIHQYLLKQAQKYELRVFYIGASQKTLSKIEERIQSEHEVISCKSYSPPYKTVFSEEDNRIMLESINAFQPDILFVGMTAPKQEKWVYKNIEHIEARIICSVGAVFDFYAGTLKRPGQFWQKIGFEWLLRLLKEPKRLWRRNFISTPIFIFDVLKEKLINLYF